MLCEANKCLRRKVSSLVHTLNYFPSEEINQVMVGVCTHSPELKYCTEHASGSLVLKLKPFCTFECTHKSVVRQLLLLHMLATTGTTRTIYVPVSLKRVRNVLMLYKGQTEIS